MVSVPCMLTRNSALAVIPTRRVSLKGTLFLALIEYTLFLAISLFLALLGVTLLYNIYA